MVNFLIERGKCFIKLNSHSVFIVTVINCPTPIEAMRESLPFFNFDIVQICSRLESCYATCAHWVHSAQSRMPGLTPGAAPGHTQSILSRFHHPAWWLMVTTDHPLRAPDPMSGASWAQTHPSLLRGGMTQDYTSADDVSSTEGKARFSSNNHSERWHDTSLQTSWLVLQFFSRSIDNFHGSLGEFCAKK